MAVLKEQLKVYLDGTMIVFAEVDDTLITSIPTGDVRVLPRSTDGQTIGFTFVENNVSNDGIAAVASFADVLDKAGVSYGATYAAVVTALNAFLNFDTGGGGTGLTGAENGLYVSGSNVSLGVNPLIENTTISGGGFSFGISGLSSLNLNGTADLTMDFNAGFVSLFGNEGEFGFAKELAIASSDLLSFTGDEGVNLAAGKVFRYSGSTSGGFTASAGLVDTRIRTVLASRAIVESDYMLIALNNITLTLPLNPPIGTTYQIFANNNNVQIAAQAPNLIIGGASLNLTGFQSVIVKYLQTNNWLTI